MIQFAYGKFASGMSRSPERIRITGLPIWDDSERFVIDAKAAAGTPVEMMDGPMLQALLEDRFHLRLHREVRQLPVYRLVVGKHGSKMRQTKTGTCVQLDPNHPIQSMPGVPTPHLCGDRRRNPSPECIYSFEFYGFSGVAICRFLEQVVDRPVIDGTRLEGRFDFHLDFARDGQDSSVGPSIFDAIEQQLGLKLASQRGPVEFLVINHVEMPAGN